MPVDISAIQSALAEAHLDGWLFYDFRGSDPLAYSVLHLPSDVFHSRRWFYFLPREGEPTKIVHAIEPAALDALPGRKLLYLPWRELNDAVLSVLTGSRRIAMQYSPMNAIPYVSRVDAGTVELVRSCGVEVVSSAELIALFEARLSDTQFATHIYAADAIAHICQSAFDEVGREIRDGHSPTEHAIQQFIMRRLEDEGLTTDHPPIVAVDAHSADPHFSPNSSKPTTIGPGQSVLIDLWAKKRDAGSIYADITKVAWVGNRPHAEYVRVFEIVRQARDAAVEAVRRAQVAKTAITGAEIDDVSRQVIDRAGFGPSFIHRTGHSIHQTGHGNGANIDNLETADRRRLIPHTLFSIEPGIYLPGKFGVRSEINVYLTEDDALVTGPPPQRQVHTIDV
jgi:Xaa-Pro aminopeptidase